ncbi:MAG: PrsW family intramembrane metalloprotease [Acidipropionibacterium sp.]|jgi:RsiW-degrading membrane proteinase PrsW (M82 family)|nr:PrsW family intramembrane metalloprotease [Acidipropionibacterium sp.]
MREPTIIRRPWWARLVRNPWTWIVLAMLIASALLLYGQYLQLHADVEVEQNGKKGVIPGITMRSFKLAAHYAWPTAAVWSLLFIWLDRFRTQHLAMWFTAFAWGAAVATSASLVVNSWMAKLLSVQGGYDPSQGAGPAIYSAPFVEETCKATILFLFAVFMRRRLTSIVQTVSLAGLSAIGFAFVENIIYYARADNYARVTIQAGDPTRAVRQLVLLRGVFTSFGHPLFTSMTAIGLAIGLRSRSRLVRILAPVTGFMGAAIGHMAFNGISSVVPEKNLKMYWFMALGVVAMLVGFLVIRLLREGTMVRNRLADYAVMGWLEPRDPFVVGSLLKRFWIAAVALSYGPRTWWRTLLFLRTATELAYLRDAVVRGIADGTEAEEVLLLDRLRQVRPLAITESKGARLIAPRLPRWWPGRRGGDQVRVFAPPSPGARPAVSWAPPRP